MRTFKDEDGREWSIHITTMALKRVFDYAKFDLADLSNNRAVELFTGQTTYLLDVLWPLVQKQAEEKSISLEVFGNALRGDSIDAAIEAIRDELMGFFPSKKRALMVPLLLKIDEAMAAAPKTMESLQVTTELGGASPTTAQA